MVHNDVIRMFDLKGYFEKPWTPSITLLKIMRVWSCNSLFLFLNWKGIPLKHCFADSRTSTIFFKKYKIVIFSPFISYEELTINTIEHIDKVFSNTYGRKKRLYSKLLLLQKVKTIFLSDRSTINDVMQLLTLSALPPCTLFGAKTYGLSSQNPYTPTQRPWHYLRRPLSAVHTFNIEKR